MSGSKLAQAPDWVLEICRKKRPRDANADLPLVELDKDRNVERAIDYLQNHAPEAIEGAGGDQITYQVAARVKDFGISEERAFELISIHWNEAEKASPPWDPAELQTKIANAYQYGTSAPGKLSGEADFSPVYIKPRTDPLTGLDLEWIFDFDPTTIPKRQWVLGNILAKGYVAGMVAPPGAGKTTLELQMAVAIASGKGEIVGMKVHRRERVFLWNQEDELDELKRRLAAILKAFKLTFDDLMIDGQPALLLGSGAENAIMIAQRGKSDKIVGTKQSKALLERFMADGIGVAMFDPFVELHGADENNNVEIAAVGRVFRAMAVKAGCAVLLVHHTRKPPAGESTGHVGNMDSARGAGSLIGVTRMGATLYTIDAKTADEHGVPEHEKHRYARLDDGKANMSLGSGEPLFYRREGVNIGTFEDPEDVGVLRPVVLLKRKSKKEREAESLLHDLEGLLEPGETATVPELARALIDADSLTYGTNPRTVAVKICRRFDEGNLSGFELSPSGQGRRARTATRLDCDKENRVSQKLSQSENATKSTK